MKVLPYKYVNRSYWKSTCSANISREYFNCLKCTFIHLFHSHTVCVGCSHASNDELGSNLFLVWLVIMCIANKSPALNGCKQTRQWKCWFLALLSDPWLCISEHLHASIFELLTTSNFL